mgnify:CR=1 FL=1
MLIFGSGQDPGSNWGSETESSVQGQPERFLEGVGSSFIMYIVSVYLEQQDCFLSARKK